MDISTSAGTSTDPSLAMLRDCRRDGLGLPGRNDAGIPISERDKTRSISYDRPETDYDCAHATGR